MSDRELQLDSNRFAVGTAEQIRWLNGIVGSIIVLNLLDAVFTLAWIRNGLAVEGNALMRDLAHGQAVLFVVAKIALVSLGCFVLWRRRTHPLAVVAIFVAFAVYYLVLLIHLQFWSYRGLAFWIW
jgi:hypothetical protein